MKLRKRKGVSQCDKVKKNAWSKEIALVWSLVIRPMSRVQHTVPDRRLTIFKALKQLTRCYKSISSKPLQEIFR